MAGVLAVRILVVVKYYNNGFVVGTVVAEDGPLEEIEVVVRAERMPELYSVVGIDSRC